MKKKRKTNPPRTHKTKIRNIFTGETVTTECGKHNSPGLKPTNNWNKVTCEYCLLVKERRDKIKNIRHLPRTTHYEDALTQEPICNQFYSRRNKLRLSTNTKNITCTKCQDQIRRKKQK